MWTGLVQTDGWRTRQRRPPFRDGDFKPPIAIAVSQPRIAFSFDPCPRLVRGPAAARATQTRDSCSPRSAPHVICLFRDSHPTRHWCFYSGEKLQKKYPNRSLNAPRLSLLRTGFDYEFHGATGCSSTPPNPLLANPELVMTHGSSEHARSACNLSLHTAHMSLASEGANLWFLDANLSPHMQRDTRAMTARHDDRAAYWNHRIALELHRKYSVRSGF